MTTNDFIQDYFNIEYIRGLVSEAGNEEALSHEKYIILCNYSHLHEYALAKGFDIIQVMEVLEEALEVQVEVSSYSDLVVNLTDHETP